MSTKTEDIFKIIEFLSTNHQLKKAAELVTKSGCDVETIRAIGKPGPMIVKTIENKNPNLVVIIKREKYEMTSSFLESLTAFLGRHAHCHLLVLDRKSFRA